MVLVPGRRPLLVFAGSPSLPCADYIRLSQHLSVRQLLDRHMSVNLMSIMIRALKIE